MKHAAIYIRVSTEEQSHASQLPELRAWEAGAVAGGKTVKWYSDKFTGRTMNRPGWNKLEAECEAGHVSEIVCWRLDRLGRTCAGLTRLFRVLQDSGIGLISLKDGINLDTPAGRLIAQVLACVAEYENETRIERVRAGVRVAHANGAYAHHGGNRRGFRKVPKKDCERLQSAGLSVREIAKVLGVSNATVWRTLRDWKDKPRKVKQYKRTT